MMQKMKSNPWMRSKALYVIPVAALALSAFATPKFVSPIEGAVSKLEGKSTEIPANLQASEEKRKVVELKEAPRVVVNGREMTPQEAVKAVQGKEIQIHGVNESNGETTLSIKTKEKVKVEETSGTTMRVRGTGGAQPLIVLDGKIFEIPEDMKDINIEREEQFTKLLNVNVEDIESITVLQKDAAVAIWGDKGSNGVIVIKTKEAKEAKQDSIYNVVAHNAHFPGGEGECFKFIAANMRYPKLCQELGVQGRVIVQFVIEKDGSITDIKKVRSADKTLTEVEVKAYRKEHPDSTEKLEAGQDLGDLLFEEGKRVLELMPKWEPAKDKDGNIVRSRFNLPLMFRLK